ncbi:MAG: AAA family ATPase [Pseudomonadota bacterium]
MSFYGTLIFFCGKMGAGKSTLSAKIARERGAVLISEDEWLAALFAGEIKDFNDYISYSSRLKPVLRSHVEQILIAGTSVVLDFPGNTRKQRAWFKDIYSQRGIPHELYYVAVDDEVCLKQLKQRQTEQPERAQFDTEEVFRMVTAYFEPPEESEAFNVEVVEHKFA